MSGVLDRRLWAISSVVILGAVMSILDTTIVNVAIDTLARDLHASLGTIQWVATGYMLALATVIPLAGWATERFGSRRLFLLSAGMFAVGSALCGFAWSAESLIGFRVLQGLGGGMLMPVGMTILTRAAGPQRVGRVMSVIGVPMLLAPVAGPVLGGWLVQDASWRYIFFVNVPIGAVSILLALRILDRDVPAREERLDWRGLLLLSPGLTALVYGLAETASNGGLGSDRVLASLTLGLLLIGAFVVHALRTERPLIDLRLFARRGFAAGAATTFLLGGALFGAMILLPLYYQVVRGEDALTAGLLLAPQGLGAAVVMPLSGRATDRSGAGRVVLTGLVLVLVSTLAFTAVGAGTPYWLLIGALFVRGLGLGMTMMPAMSAAYATLETAAVPRATTALNILNRVGGSVGTALLAVILQTRITDAFGTGAGLGSTEAASPAARAAAAPALAHAFGSTFWWAAAMVAASFLPALLLPRASSPKAAVGEALPDAA
jgi:EmrB/QacA subfamily drug resistance transporter